MCYHEVGRVMLEERSPSPFAMRGCEGHLHLETLQSGPVHIPVFLVCTRRLFTLCLSPSHDVKLISGLSSQSHFLVKYQEVAHLSRNHVRAASSSYLFSGGEPLPGAELLWEEKA